MQLNGIIDLDNVLSSAVLVVNDGIIMEHMESLTWIMFSSIGGVRV